MDNELAVKNFQHDLSFPLSTRNFCVELMMISIQIDVVFVDRTWNIMFHREWLCSWRTCYLYQTHRQCHRKSSFVFILFSGVSIQGTKCWRKQRMFNMSWRILWRLPTEIPNSVAVWSTDFLMSISHNLLHTIDICCIFDVDGQLLCVSSSTLSRLSWKSLCQSHIWDVFATISQYACCDIVNNNAGDFWSNTQNIRLVHCSNTNIFTCDWPHAH